MNTVSTDKFDLTEETYTVLLKDEFFGNTPAEGDNPGILAFTVAGFSQHSDIDKKNRQKLYNYIASRTIGFPIFDK